MARLLQSKGSSVSWNGPQWRSVCGSVYGQSVASRLNFSLGRYATVFQTEICAILGCVYEIQWHNRPENYVSFCCDSQAALTALHAVRTSSAVGPTVPKDVE